VEDPFVVLEENHSMRRAPPPARVEDMFEQIKSKLPGAPRFLLCLLPERKNSDIYGVSCFLFLFNQAHIFPLVLLCSFYNEQNHVKL